MLSNVQAQQYGLNNLNFDYDLQNLFIGDFPEKRANTDLQGLASVRVARFDTLCRKTDKNCENPYTSEPMSYQAGMMRADFFKFGLGLETLLKQHYKHASIDNVIANLAADLRGKYRLISDIMKNASDQIAWEEILYLIAEQFEKIGRKLGPKKLRPAGLAKDFEIAGDLLGQFIDEHRVEFNYPQNQVKFTTWRLDITSTFGAVDRVLTLTQPHLNNVNFGHIVGVHFALTNSIKLALASPTVPVLMNLEKKHNAHDTTGKKLKHGLKIFEEGVTIPNIEGLKDYVKRENKKTERGWQSKLVKKEAVVKKDLIKDDKKKTKAPKKAEKDSSKKLPAGEAVAKSSKASAEKETSSGAIAMKVGILATALGLISYM